ncbi:hypothetical protein LK07_12880 [Streptomyces pluripotens]|uniref:Glycerophosphoryl diester phosphodiesterase membrane domain-containing protein n=1 Tax=Streptomyces pluripotens TaxID=1355015 RepID=A0A221NY10_9ACTN|nr:MULTISPECIES: glycerophosphoryl diester phosphodiesterase membrane domain-containing protein [Streptomyces]ARP70525.1 hypothetical protein LK06_011750 [Streptomyces pluripotens]ASN24782.1 hypothetical protein LK07_12880 [Streptomyces pluripotens]KIE28914.1 membrane protein [Streptomyces sp. MUSC 125]MCH0560571.1 glycerophosphoryl diester phosphodiesterase membrane domain-containing protein [Streptomyces sp. MUM 16J]
MTDTPGWASPGSAPSSEGREPGASGPADHPGPTEPAQQPGPIPQGPGVKWSKEQPPPGQWSAPTGAPTPQAPPPRPPSGPGWGGQQPGGPGPGGYGGPPAGPGGYGAWGSGWGGPPPAAKPGVIPLRPLGVGEILDGAVSTMRTYWRTVLAVSVAVALVVDTSLVLVQGLIMNDAVTTSTFNDRSATPDEVFHALRASMIGTGIVAAISMVAVIVATALLTTITSRAVLGRPITAVEAWREARPQIPKLFGMLVLLALIVGGVVFVGALPGLIIMFAGSGNGAGAALLALGIVAALIVAGWLMIRFYLATPVLILERQSILKALSRSAKLVRGSWWRIFGIMLLTGLITNIVASLVGIPFTFIGAAVSGDSIGNLLGASGGHLSWTFLIIRGIGSVVGTTLTLPISAGVTVLLYIDQRIRREALDLELARAAGAQGAGSAAGTIPGS